MTGRVPGAGEEVGHTHMPILTCTHTHLYRLLTYTYTCAHTHMGTFAHVRAWAQPGPHGHAGMLMEKLG